jgi:hypothetical protein
MEKSNFPRHAFLPILPMVICSPFIIDIKNDSRNRFNHVVMTTVVIERPT